MTGPSDAASRAAIRAWIDQQHQEMERSSYYLLLGVARDATDDALRDAYYRLVARFHPDLYGDTIDGTTREKLVSLYSRLVEAYQTLSDHVKRGQYDRQLAGGRLRFSAEEERAAAAKSSDGEISNPSAKRFFNLGKSALRAGDVRGAIMNLKLALSCEPGSAQIRAELTRAEGMQK
jgi:curved DNA-binding protein CbpA